MIIVDYQLMLKLRLYTMDMLQEEKHNLEKIYNLEHQDDKLKCHHLVFQYLLTKLSVI